MVLQALLITESTVEVLVQPHPSQGWSSKLECCLPECRGLGLELNSVARETWIPGAVMMSIMVTRNKFMVEKVVGNQIEPQLKSLENYEILCDNKQ